MLGTAGRRVASILIAVLIALTSVTVSVEAVREAVKSFFAKMEVFDTHTEISFPTTGENPSDTVTAVAQEPAHIPAGYAEKERQEDIGRLSIQYINDNGGRIRFLRNKNAGATIHIDTEGITYTEITINGREGITYTKNGTTSVFLWDDGYVYTFSSAALGEDELIKMAESLQ